MPTRVQFPSGPIPKSVPKALRTRIEFWDDERNIDNGIVVTLKGWRWEEHDGAHVRGFDEVTDVISGLRESIKCKCPKCLE